MVWRIHFSEDDLARIQVSPTLGPLAETVLAVGCSAARAAAHHASEWRGQVRVTPRMRPLTALIPPDCRGVDLPTLVGETATIEQGVQALLDVPREHLLVEMEWIDRRHRLPPLAWAMAEAGGRPELAEATQVAYRSWSSHSGPASAPACTPSRPPAAGRWPRRVPARCWPRCRARGSAGGRRSWRS